MTAAIDNAPRFYRLADTAGCSGKLHNYDYISGLILALVSGPELISPSEWLELIYLDDVDPPVVEDEKAFEQLVGELMTIWNYWAGETGEYDKPLEFPEHYRIDNDDPSDSLRNFARGVLAGYSWLEEDWNALFESLDDTELKQQVDQIFGMSLVSAMMLSDPVGTTRTILEEGDTPPTLEDSLRGISVGLFALAGIGRMGQDLPEGSDEFDEPAINPLRNVGRNDPCPCGSGKKYKKCCLN